MIFGNDRNELRQMYQTAWRKRCNGEPMSPLDSQIADVVAEHPEYHEAVTGDLNKEYTVEQGTTNPFLHMGLHLGIREQVATDRPTGIAAVFTDIAARLNDAHKAEHRMIDCLAEALWEAQRTNSPPDEAAYLERLRKL